MLARLIKKLKPDLIHSMEFQHCGYNVLQAREIVGKANFPKWLATNWGSDIFYYRHDPAHNAQNPANSFLQSTITIANATGMLK